MNRAHRVGALANGVAGMACGVVAVFAAYRGGHTVALGFTAAAILFVLIGAAIVADWQRRLKEHGDL
jgi:hypothetical protein